MTFIQGESSCRQSAFINVCPRTFMVMCHYQVSLVLISRGFFPQHTHTDTHNSFCQRETEGEEKGAEKKKFSWGNSLGWGGDEDGWDERKKKRLDLHFKCKRSHQATRAAHSKFRDVFVKKCLLSWQSKGNGCHLRWAKGMTDISNMCSWPLRKPSVVDLHCIRKITTKEKSDALPLVWLD